VFGHDTLSNFYLTNFAMVQHHKYSLHELEDMMPWERVIYIELLNQYLKDKEEREKKRQERGF